MSSVEHHRTGQNQSIFRHTAKPEWGGAVIAWEREGKRGYQFEDGQLRVFTSAHYHLLDSIEVSADRIRTLHALAGRPAPAEPVPALPAALPIFSLDEQIAFFLRSYPGGFAGDKWRDGHRGGGGRVLKRHRDQVIAFAQSELTANKLTTWLDRRLDHEAMQAFCNVLSKTDLVAWTQVQRLSSLPANRTRVILAGLLDLLHGRESTSVRLVQWIQSINRGTGRMPGWQLATAPLALLRPNEHVCVQRTIFLALAASLSAEVKLGATPNGHQYGPLLDMAGRVRSRLADATSAPADFLDVYDFLSLTLSTASGHEMAARRSS